MTRVLIADGNIPADRRLFTKYNGCAPSGMFEQLLRANWPGIETEICYPTDPGAISSLPPEGYDGILFTGSNSNIYKREPETLRQIEFAQAALASGTPVFGVCWGLQLATVALGGEVQPSRSKACRCEVPFASGIRLHEDMRSHAMHRGRPDMFDAFAFHSDEVTMLPPGSTVTASNDYFIQAAEIRCGKSVFWGVQYHPELTGPGLAGFLRGSANELVAGGRYENEREIESAASALDSFAPEATVSEHESHHFSRIHVSSFNFRPIEIINWIDYISGRGKT